MLSQRVRVGIVAGLVALPAIAEGREAGDRLQIIVSVFNRAGVDQHTILAAEKTSARIYGQVGVDIVWKNCRTQAEPEVDPCEPTTDRSQLVLHIEHQTRMFTADAYGVAFLGDDGWGTFCDVFYDRILELHHGGRASEATILGIVVAHELGHLLLGPDAHSAMGIMRPQWRSKDFLTSEFATTFNRQQGQKICARLAQATLMSRASR